MWRWCGQDTKRRLSLVGMVSVEEGGNRVRSWRRRQVMLKLSKDHCLAVNVMKPGWESDPRIRVMKLSTLGD